MVACAGAAATASALRSSVTGLARQQSGGGRQQLEEDDRSGAETYSFHAAVGAAVLPQSHPPSAPASSYAPSEGIPSSRQSPHSARGLPVPLGGRAAAAPPPQVRPHNSLLTKLNRAQGGAYADSASRYDTYSRGGVRCGRLLARVCMPGGQTHLLQAPRLLRFTQACPPGPASTHYPPTHAPATPQGRGHLRRAG